MPTEKKIITIEADYSSAVKALLESKQLVSDLRAANKQLNDDYKAGTITQQQYASQIEVNNAKIKNLSKEVNNNAKALQEEVLQVKGSEGAYQKLNLQYQLAAQKAKDLAASENATSTEIENASKIANDYNEKLKKIDATTGSYNRNVGDYKNQIIAAVKELTTLKTVTSEMEAEQKKLQSAHQTGTTEYKLLSNAIEDNKNKIKSLESGNNDLISSMDKVAPATSGTIKGFIDMGKSMWALVANPIGAVIAAIALALFGLYSVFKNFKPVVDLVEQSMAALGAIFSVVKNVIIGLFTGQQSLTESTKGLGAAMSDAAKSAMELKKAQQELEDGQANLDELNKKSETQIQRLMLQSRNRSISEQERIKILEKAQNLSTEIYKRNKQQNDNEVKNAEEALRIKMGLTSTEMVSLRKYGSYYAEKMQEKRGMATDEIKTLHDALMKREDIKQLDIAIQEKSQNRIEALADKAEEKEKARQEKAKAAYDKQMSQSIRTTEKILSDRAKVIDAEKSDDATSETSYNKKISRINQLAKDENDALNTKSKFEKMTSDKLEAARDVIKENQLKRIKDVTSIHVEALITSMNNELKLQELHDKELRAGRQTTYKEEQADLLKKLNADIASNSLRLQNDKDYTDQSKLIYQQYYTDSALLDAQNAETIKSNKATQLANELEIVQGNIDAESEIKKQQLIAQQTEELRVTGTTAEQKTIINKKYAILNKNIDRDALNAKLDMAAQVTDGISNLLGKETIAGKLAASATVAINTYKSAAEIQAQANKYFANPLTIPLGILAEALVGVQIASGLKSIADINNVNTNVSSDTKSTDTVTSKFHTGGIAGNDAMSPDSSNELTATLLKGERVLSLQQTGVFNSILGNLSNLGGSANITNNIGTQSNNNAEMIADALAKKIVNLPNPQISWTEFERQAQRQQQLKNNLVVR